MESLGRIGLPLRLVAAKVGVNEATLRSWLDEDPALTTAVEDAQAQATKAHLDTIIAAARAGKRAARQWLDARGVGWRQGEGPGRDA